MAIALAFPGVAWSALPDNFQDELVTGGLDQPSSLAFLPDGRVLVTEQNTRDLRLVVNGTLVSGALITVSDVNTSGNERGLLGVTVDPWWPGRPYVYLMFDRTPGAVTYISRFTATGDLSDRTSSALTLGSRYDILTDIPDAASNHNGGTLRFGPDCMLYASLGDDANSCAAQDSSDFRGVILRMDMSALPDTTGGPPLKSLITPGDNPFPATDPEAGLTYCFGLRNPFRFHIDRVTERLYIGDVGQRDYEEVSESSGGENFGWPFREGPNVRTQGGCSEPGGSGSQSYDDPIAGYDRSGFSPASIIAGPRYRVVAGGVYSFPPLYDGVLFFSEYYEGFLRAVRDSAGTWVPLTGVAGQPNGEDWATGITNVGDYLEGRDGAIYYVKQFPGELRRIVYTETVSGFPDDRTSVQPILSVRPNPYLAAQGQLAVEINGEGSGRADVIAVSGKRVRTLFEGDLQGRTTVYWNGESETGGAAPAGVYFVRFVGSFGHAASRIVLLH